MQTHLDIQNEIARIEAKINKAKSFTDSEMEEIDSELFNIEDCACVESGSEASKSMSDDQFDFVIEEIRRLSKMAYNKY